MVLDLSEVGGEATVQSQFCCPEINVLSVREVLDTGFPHRSHFSTNFASDFNFSCMFTDAITTIWLCPSANKLKARVYLLPQPY